MFTLISYQHASSGFYEDDWQIIRTISSPKELLEALKEGYLKDASKRSQYPLNGFNINTIFIKENLTEYEGFTFLGGYYHDSSFEPDNPDFRYYEDDTELFNFIHSDSEYKKCFILFNKWKSKIKTLIPLLRNLKYEKDKYLKELDTLKVLAEKHGFNLTKREEF